MIELYDNDKNFYINDISYELYKLYWLSKQISIDEYFEIVRDYCEYKQEQILQGCRKIMTFDDWLEYKNVVDENNFPTYEYFCENEIYDRDLMINVLGGKLYKVLFG